MASGKKAKQQADGRRAEDRRGRGRLSSIDLLPDEAEDDVRWALEQLRERNLPQNAIHAEFNERLMDKGIEPISKSAFNRYSIRKAVQFRKLDQVQAISGELVDNLGTDGPDQVTIAVAEMLKLASFELLEDGGLTSKGVMELSRALQSSVSAQKGSAEYRNKLEAEAKKKLEEAAKALNEFGKKNGVSKEAMETINRRLMGGE